MGKLYDLEQRTFVFAKDCRMLIRSLKSAISNFEDGKQLVRSSGLIGAYYSDAKESSCWLRRLKDVNPDDVSLDSLLTESEELRKILSSISIKVTK